MTIISAATYTLPGLKQLRTRNPSAFYTQVDFTLLPMDQIDNLFPKGRGERRSGQLDPPLDWRACGEKLKEWRLLGEEEQRGFVVDGDGEEEEKQEVVGGDKREEEFESTEKVSTTEVSNATSADVAVNSTSVDQTKASSSIAAATNGVEVKCVEDHGIGKDGDVREFTILTCGDGDDGMDKDGGDSTTAARGEGREKRSLRNNIDDATESDLPQQKRARSDLASSVTNNNTTTPTPQSKCKGQTLASLDNRCRSHVDEIKRGFHLLVGNAMRYKASYISRNCKWTRGKSVVGCLVHPSNHKRGSDVEETVTWVCSLINETEYAFHRPNCDDSTTISKSTECCTACTQGRNEFCQLCRSEASNHGLLEGRTNYFAYKSSTFIVPRIQKQVRQSKKLKKKIADRDIYVERLKQQIANEEIALSQSPPRVLPKPLKKTFPMMLHNLISACSVTHPSVACFSSCGTAFFIHKKVRLGIFVPC